MAQEFSPDISSILEAQENEQELRERRRKERFAAFQAVNQGDGGAFGPLAAALGARLGQAIKGRSDAARQEKATARAITRAEELFNTRQAELLADDPTNVFGAQARAMTEAIVELRKAGADKLANDMTTQLAQLRQVEEQRMRSVAAAKTDQERAEVELQRARRLEEEGTGRPLEKAERDLREREAELEELLQADTQDPAEVGKARARVRRALADVENVARNRSEHVQADPDELTMAARTKLQTDMFDLEQTMTTLQGLRDNFTPEALTLFAQFGSGAMNAAERLGIPVPEGAREFLADTEGFKANAVATLSEELNRLSGAAISPPEAERLMKGFPTADDGPTKFIAKIEATIGRLENLHARKAFILGLGKVSRTTPTQVQRPGPAAVEEVKPEAAPEAAPALTDEEDAFLQGLNL